MLGLITQALFASSLFHFLRLVSERCQGSVPPSRTSAMAAPSQGCRRGQGRPSVSSPVANTECARAWRQRRPQSEEARRQVADRAKQRRQQSDQVARNKESERSRQRRLQNKRSAEARSQEASRKTGEEGRSWQSAAVGRQKTPRATQRGRRHDSVAPGRALPGDDGASDGPPELVEIASADAARAKQRRQQSDQVARSKESERSRQRRLQNKRSAEARSQEASRKTGEEGRSWQSAAVGRQKTPRATQRGRRHDSVAPGRALPGDDGASDGPPELVEIASADAARAKQRRQQSDQVARSKESERSKQRRRRSGQSAEARRQEADRKIKDRAMSASQRRQRSTSTPGKQRRQCNVQSVEARSAQS